MSTTSVEFTTTPSGSEPPAPAQAQADRPAWLPEQFKSVEDYAKALGDTKAELTRSQQELAKLKKPAAETPPAEPAKDALAIPEKTDETGDAQDEAAKKVAEESGIDFAPYQQEFVQSGDVGEESRARIADGLKGLFGEDARSIVDEYIEGAKARAANSRSQIVGVAGGEDGYGKMLAWASANLTDAEKATYNAQINSGDFNAAMFAAQGLRARFESAKGKAPNLVNGDTAAAPSGGPFKSLHEMKAAISDPRYKADPDYRRSVEQRVMTSNL